MTKHQSALYSSFSCRTGPTLLPPPPRRFAPREKGRSRRRRSRWRWEETATQKNWFSIYHTAPRGLCILRLWLSQHSPNGWEAKQPKIGLTLSHVFIFFSTRLLLICCSVSAFLFIFSSLPFSPLRLYLLFPCRTTTSNRKFTSYDEYH